MSFFDSLLVSIFGLGIVFAVLIALCGLVIFQSKLFSMLFSGKKKIDGNETADSAEQAAAVSDSGITAGELKLFDVDERTAAMIMAIVSDESQIPLSQLQFKSIKVVD